MTKYLQLLYSSKKHGLFFADCDIQEVIEKNIDIRQVIKFSGLAGCEDKEHIEVRKLYYYHTYWDMIYLNDSYGYRFMETNTILNNGIRMLTDLNLTSVNAPSAEALFNHMTPSLTSFGLDADKCIALIKSRPDEHIAILMDENGELSVDKWSDKFREDYTSKSWNNHLNEEGVPEMVPF